MLLPRESHKREGRVTGPGAIPYPTMAVNTTRPLSFILVRLMYKFNVSQAFKKKFKKSLSKNQTVSKRCSKNILANFTPFNFFVFNKSRKINKIFHFIYYNFHFHFFVFCLFFFHFVKPIFVKFVKN